MLIWRGFGILVAVIVALAVVLLQLLTDLALGGGAYARLGDWLFPLGLLIAAAIIWPLGRRLNGGGRTLLDPQTGQQVVLRPDHSLFFIKMEYWAFILAAAALVLLAVAAIS